MSVVDKPIITSNERGAPAVEDNYLTHSRGFLSWALTLDHKRIGLMYLAGIMTAFAIGGVLALLIRAHLWNPNIMTEEMFAQSCRR